MKANHALTAVLLLVLLALPAAAAGPAGLLPAAPPTPAGPLARATSTGIMPRLSLPAVGPADRWASGREDMSGLNPASGTAALPAGVSGDWWAAVQEDIRQSEYQVTWQTIGANGRSPLLAGLTAAYQAPSRAQGFRTYFTEEGIRVVPRVSLTSTPGARRSRAGGEGEAWQLALSGLGPVEPAVAGNRAEYAQDGVTEWFVNTEEGLETGFRVEEGPGTKDEGSLVLRLSSSALTPRLTPDGTTLELLGAAGIVVLRYGPFHAVDAAGRPVPVHLSLASSSLLVSLSPHLPVSSLLVSSSPRLPVSITARLAAPPERTDSLGGLFPPSTWIAESDQASAFFGVAVGAAGDVNGDGYGDVIVGARQYDNGQNDEGAAFVYYGSAAGLSPAPSWTAESDQANAHFGWSVGTAGDVNGDGYDDVVVGACDYDSEGRAFVYYGSATGLSPDADWTAESDQSGSAFGSRVATAGDVDGDGYADVIVGAMAYDNPLNDEGAAFVWYGSAGGLGPNGTPANADWRAESNQEGARFGAAADSAGDVNDDGYDDVIVGARNYDNGQTDEGRAFVYYGSASGLSPDPDWTAESDQADAYFGQSVATAGDVNGDGYGDVVVGAYGYNGFRGKAYLYMGSASGLSPDPAWTAESDQDYSLFGQSLGVAGDVNGDGYADVIISAYAYDNGEPDEGQVYVYHGGPMGLPPAPDWTVESNQATAHFGYSVATAGDVDGDGYDDVIVGAHRYDNGQVDEGRAFVYHGSSAGLDPGPAWTAESDATSAHFGTAAGTAGDVNGDGYGDVIVGAYLYDNGQGDEGAAFVYYGTASGLPPDPAWTVVGDQAGASLGYAAGTAGDVNGDGYGDIIVGAYLYDNGEVDEGRVYVYLGSAAGLSTTAAWTAESNQAYAYFGVSAGAAGDVDGDGYGDIIVGADRYDNGNTDEGAVFAWYGSAGGLGPNGTPANADWTVEGNQDNAWFGHMVASAGDVNGDGYGDVIVGAPYYDNDQLDEGRAYVYLGSAAGLAAAPVWTAESDQGYACFGWDIGMAGDVNGDGYGDVLVGAYLYDNGQTDEGAVFAWYGSAGGLGPNGTPDNARWRVESDQGVAYMGGAVGTAGDVNGDGYADVVVGADLHDYGQPNEGAAFVYHGSAQGLDAAPAWTMVGEQVEARAGIDVGTAGDVNGDGYSDVIVGVRIYDNGQEDEGRVYVYYGSPGSLARAAGWTVESDQGSAQLGLAVGSAGDVNGDGYADVIVGAPYYDNGQGDEGRAYVYPGSPAGPSPSPTWWAEGQQPQANLGWAVGTAGDVDGDGYADVIVGAPGFDNGQADEGGVFVWHGSPTGLGPYGTPGNARWRAEGDQVNAYLGHAAATAGDVNGDGYADVVVGAYGYDNGQADEGRAYTYLGSAVGLATTPAWTAEGDQVNAHFGLAVGTAGDTDGDGYSDVVAGAPRFDNGETDEGRAYVYRGSASGLSSAPPWTAEGGQAGAQFGFAVGTAGDTDGDGYAEVIVGAPYHDHGPGRPDVGRAYLYYGSAAGTLPAAGWMVEGDHPWVNLGYAVGTAGDVNGDGYADAIVGAPYYSGGPADEGRVLVYLGMSAGLSPTARWTVGGEQANAHLGYAVVTAGDVNGDGYADVVVGAPLYSNGQASEGAAQLYYGNGRAGLDLSPRQLRADGTAPIAPLGMSDSPTAVQLRLTGRMPLGREEVKLQWQAAPLSTPFTATTVISGTSATWTDTLTSGVLITSNVSGLIPGAPYHWRVRLLYRPGNLLGQATGHWVHLPWNGWTEQDFRTPGECYPPANAAFSWAPPLPAVGETIIFTGAATGTLPLAFGWQFGDGASAGAATVTHTYALTGTYEVVLTVAGPCGSRALVAHTVYVGFPGGWQVYLPLVNRGY